MKKKTKIFIMVIATIACIAGGSLSSEPMNYFLWWLMFVLVCFG